MFATQINISKPRMAFATGQPNKAKTLTMRPQLVVRASSKPEDNKGTFEKLALPAAAFLGAALLMVSTPDPAEAARSGGRVGGSSFSSRPRMSAPSRSSAAPSVRNYNSYSVAPPLIGGYGYGGYGMGMPMIVGGPVFGFGGFFNIILFMFVINLVLSTVRSFTNNNKKDKDGSWSDENDDRWQELNPEIAAWIGKLQAVGAGPCKGLLGVKTDEVDTQFRSRVELAFPLPAVKAAFDSVLASGIAMGQLNSKWKNGFNPFDKESKWNAAIEPSETFVQSTKKRRKNSIKNLSWLANRNKRRRL